LYQGTTSVVPNAGTFESRALALCGRTAAESLHKRKQDFSAAKAELISILADDLKADPFKASISQNHTGV
jgi:hypothetical protein